MCAATISDIFKSMGLERPQKHAKDYPEYLKKKGATEIPASKAINMNAWDLAGNLIVYEGDHDWGNRDFGHVAVLVAVQDGDTYVLKMRSNFQGEVKDLPAKLWSGNNRNLEKERPAWSVWDMSTMWNIDTSPGQSASRSASPRPAPRSSADGYISNPNRGAASIMAGDTGDKFADIPNGMPVMVLEQRENGIMKVQPLNNQGEPSGSAGWISTESFKLR